MKRATWYLSCFLRNERFRCSQRQIISSEAKTNFKDVKQYTFFLKFDPLPDKSVQATAMNVC